MPHQAAGPRATSGSCAAENVHACSRRARHWRRRTPAAASSRLAAPTRQSWRSRPTEPGPASATAAATARPCARIVSDLLRAKLELADDASDRPGGGGQAAGLRSHQHDAEPGSRDHAQAPRRRTRPERGAAARPQLCGRAWPTRVQRQCRGPQAGEHGRGATGARRRCSRRRARRASSRRPTPGARRSARNSDAMRGDERARIASLLVLAAKGGENAKPAKGWLKSAEQQLEPRRPGAPWRVAARPDRDLRARRHNRAAEPEHAARAAVARRHGRPRGGRPAAGSSTRRSA